VLDESLKGKLREKNVLCLDPQTDKLGIEHPVLVISFLDAISGTMEVQTLLSSFNIRTDGSCSSGIFGNGYHSQRIAALQPLVE
jgi:hypothetical protein